MKKREISDRLRTSRQLESICKLENNEVGIILHYQNWNVNSEMVLPIYCNSTPFRPDLALIKVEPTSI